MSISDAQFLKGWRQVLEMCNLKAGEQVTILTSDDSNKQIAYIAKLAASDLGAVVTELNLAPVNAEKAISPDKSGYIGKTPLDGNSAALACLMASDMVIDTLQLLFSKEQEEVLKTGTRMLLAVEPPAIMMRQIPRPEDKLRVLAAAKKIGAAKEMHVTSKAGTDFRCRLGQYPVLTQYGLADEPGRWDHWPSCFSARWPDEGSAEGTIVIDEGDILLPFKKYARAPITVTIEKGFIVDIKGGYDAEFMRKFMDSFNDPRAYAMAHVGWGARTLQPRGTTWHGCALVRRQFPVVVGSEYRSRRRSRYAMPSRYSAAQLLCLSRWRSHDTGRRRGSCGSEVRPWHNTTWQSSAPALLAPFSPHG
jgi:2,5-dihydroxypyridine 5,6-dioxygenase